MVLQALARSDQINLSISLLTPLLLYYKDTWTPPWATVRVLLHGLDSNRMVVGH